MSQDHNQGLNILTLAFVINISSLVICTQVGENNKNDTILPLAKKRISGSPKGPAIETNSDTVMPQNSLY